MQRTRSIVLVLLLAACGGGGESGATSATCGRLAEITCAALAICEEAYAYDHAACEGAALEAMGALELRCNWTPERTEKDCADGVNSLPQLSCSELYDLAAKASDPDFKPCGE